MRQHGVGGLCADDPDELLARGAADTRRRCRTRSAAPCGAAGRCPGSRRAPTAGRASARLPVERDREAVRLVADPLDQEQRRALRAAARSASSRSRVKSSSSFFAIPTATRFPARAPRAPRTPPTAAPCRRRSGSGPGTARPSRAACGSAAARPRASRRSRHDSESGLRPRSASRLGTRGSRGRRRWRFSTELGRIGTASGLECSCRCDPTATADSRAPSPRIRNFRYSDRFIRPSSHTTIEATVSAALDRRDVEALDAARNGRQRQHRAQRFERVVVRGDVLVEARLIGDLRVARRQVEQPALLAAASARRGGRGARPAPTASPRASRCRLALSASGRWISGGAGRSA